MPSISRIQKSGDRPRTSRVYATSSRTTLTGPDVEAGLLTPTMRLPQRTAMKERLPRWHARACHRGASSRRPTLMLHAGLDLSRHRLDVCLLSERGELVVQTAAPPDGD